MNAPVFFIFLPLLLSVVLYIFRRWKMTTTLTAVFLAVFLVLLAWRVPIGQTVGFGTFTVILSPELSYFGRSLTLTGTDQTMLMLIYGSTVFWFIGGFAANTGKEFIPVSLGLVAINVAALAVRPFLYAAFLLEISILLSLPLLTRPGKTVDQGVLRYVVLMSLGLPFFLFGSWYLSQANSDAKTAMLFIPGLVFIGIGFIFFLAIFPAHTWIPMVTQRAHPYAMTFVLVVIPGISMILLFRFIAQFSGIFSLEVIQLFGIAMMALGGIMAIFQQDLGRLLGFAFIIELGRSLLAAGHPAGAEYYALMYIPRLIAFGVLALSLAVIRAEKSELHFRNMKGAFRRFPVASTGVLAALFSIVGYPLFAGFPVILALLKAYIQSSLPVTAGVFIGSLGLFVGGLRSAGVLIEEMDQQDWPETKNRQAQILIIIGIISLIILGLFPEIVRPISSEIASIFRITAGE